MFNAVFHFPVLLTTVAVVVSLMHILENQNAEQQMQTGEPLHGEGGGNYSRYEKNK